MDYCLSLHKAFAPASLFSSSSSKSKLRQFSGCARRRPLVVLAGAGASHCEFGSLNTPLELRSSAGRHLSRVLQNFRQLFNGSVEEELRLLSEERDSAAGRMLLAADSDESFLHRRIAQLKEQECQVAVEDVMYMLIFYRFSEIRVTLVPKLSRCIYNSRLEILPCKHWELESIYDLEVLEMIREHIATVIGLRTNSSVADNWAMTNIRQPHLGRVYVASILYGYFLKSALLRHNLEQSLAIPNSHLIGNQTLLRLPKICVYGLRNLISGCLSNNQPVSHRQVAQMESEKLKSFLTGFDSEALQRCAKVRSQEALNLIENHSRALFGDEKTGFSESDDVIVTTFSSLKRLVLEAVAFGSFLWDAEEYVGSLYSLKEN